MRPARPSDRLRLLALLVMVLLAAACVEETTRTTAAPSGDGDEPTGATPDPQRPGPAPAPPPASGGSRAFFTTVPGYTGTSGSVQWDMRGLEVQGREIKHGLVLISNAGAFRGGNWIYVKCLETFPGRVAGSCKIEAEGQGAARESGYTGGTRFQPERIYRFRVEWGGGRVQLFVDGAPYTSLALARDVAITGLHVWINETPRAGPEPPYARGEVGNVQISGG
jgi:hypothetical protein